MEITTNVRLFDFFEQKDTLCIQCGDKAKRTTIDHLLSLEDSVSKAQANSEQIVFIFFNMEKKIYDLTWTHGMDKNEAGIEGIMFNVIQKLSQTKILQRQS